MFRESAGRGKLIREPSLSLPHQLKGQSGQPLLTPTDDCHLDIKIFTFPPTSPHKRPYICVCVCVCGLPWWLRW